MKVRLEMPIVIPAGLILNDTPRRTVRYEAMGDTSLGVDSLEVSEMVVVTHPDRFTILEE